MKTTEILPCICGKGALEVEVLTLGTWTIEKILMACPTCDSTDIEKARAAMKEATG